MLLLPLSNWKSSGKDKQEHKWIWYEELAVGRAKRGRVNWGYKDFREFVQLCVCVRVCLKQWEALRGLEQGVNDQNMRWTLWRGKRKDRLKLKLGRSYFKQAVIAVMWGMIRASGVIAGSRSEMEGVRSNSVVEMLCYYVVKPVNSSRSPFAQSLPFISFDALSELVNWFMYPCPPPYNYLGIQIKAFLEFPGSNCRIPGPEWTLRKR